jgi:tetratricopeptide (TPR) repeat protein
MNSAKPTQKQLDDLIQFYQTGRYVDAEKISLTITQKFPKHPLAWKVLTVVLQQTGRIKESLASSQKSTQLEPQDSSAHNNLGTTLKKLNKFEEAESSYRQAILLKPDFAEAHYNLGNTLQELNKFEEAESSYRQAILLKPDFALGYSSLGFLLQNIGKLEEAIITFAKAIDINPQLSLPRKDLIQLLTIYTPQEEFSHPIIRVNKEIKEIYQKENISGMISDDNVIQIICKSTNIINEHSLELESQFSHISQVYRKNSIDLNCKRHKSIFNKFNIIPDFCFGCYKVQVEPRSILELIKLLLVFDQIKLDNNNTRKCMIEMRSEVSGFYKGLIYCSSMEEAYQISDYLEIVLKENIEPKLYPAVKRGCSEYSISFPDYKVIAKSGPQLMNYNKDWKLIEEEHDSSSLKTINNKIPLSLFGLNLNDVLIIQNWIDYAKGIGDPSVHLLKENTVFSPNIYKIAKTRVKKYPWQKKTPK